MAFSSPRAGLSIPRRALQLCTASSPLNSFGPAATRSFSRSLARRQGASIEDRIAADDTDFSTATEVAKTANVTNVNVQDLPRWSQTPDRMKAPFSLAIPRNEELPPFRVNEDIAVLDEVYDRFLGRDGHRLLPEELKWLAVTHKSFDQGRRGFNTRLAHLGRSILQMETLRYIMASPAAPLPQVLSPDRKPFQHAALANFDKLIAKQPMDLVTKDKIARLAFNSGLHKAVRWLPRDRRRLEDSGLAIVLHSAVYSILGAISLQHGAAVASKLCRERILSKLDL